MNCPKCGTAVPEGSDKCPGCGASMASQDLDATWAGSAGKQSHAAKSAGDDVTDAGLETKKRPQVASDVLTPPPGFVDRNPTHQSTSDDATWVGGVPSTTFGAGAPTMAPNAATVGPNSPTMNRPFASRSGPGWGAAATPALGDKIDFGPRYRVEKLLGQGGMGAVYKAYDIDLDRVVALKLVRPELMVHPQAMARFRQELLLASKISHRNILRIHDLGDAGGMKFISMAYVDGEDLHHVLLREGKLPLERMLHISKQLCSALDAAHSENVVHRDLKPQNIMLGVGDLVQVSDFGLAKSVGAETGAGMTQSGEMLGTPRYMAPEQVEAKHVDARTDIYALGLIFYEMVTGDVPFTAETTLQLMYKRAHETPAPPNTVVPDLPLWLNDVIVKCLACNPDERYQSARDILHDLENETGPDVKPQTREIKLPQVAVRVPSKKMWIGMAALVVAMIGGTLAVPPVRHAIFGGNASQQAAEPKLRSVAILPLRVSADNAEDALDADGIVDSLSAKLFQLKDVHLISPSDVARLKPGLSAPEIGKMLGANLILRGTYQAKQGKMHLTLTLDNAQTGQLVWTKDFQGLNTDIISIEDHIGDQVLNALNVNLNSDERARANIHATDKIAAYQAYLEGRNAMRGKIDEAAARKALKHYKDALQQDRNFALAYAGIADASLRLYKQTSDPNWANQATSAAEQAENLGSSFPEVHFVMGSVYEATGRTNEAIAELLQALKLAPNSDDGYRRLGQAYRSSNQKASIEAYEKAIQINPYYWYNYNALGSAYFYFGKDSDAIQAYKKEIEIAPDISTGYTNLGSVYVRAGNYQDAIQQFEAALKIDPKNTIAISGLGNAYFFMKKYADAAKAFEQQVSLTPNDEIANGNLADCYRWMGDKQKANATYDKAIALAQKNLQVNPRDSEAMSSLALYFAKEGHDNLAEQYIHRARAVNGSDPELIYIEGEVNALAGHDDEAVKFITEAIQKGYPVDQARTDPELSKLTSRPDFAKLLHSQK